MADNKIRSSKTASAVKNGGHVSSGGRAGSHNISQGRSKNSTVAKLWNMSKEQWNTNDNISGGLMPTPWQEYPKHVYPEPGNMKNYVHVNNEEEERLALGGDKIVREEDEHERLVALAGVKGVQADKRWGVPRLTKAIEDAGHDSSVNPFK